MEIPTGSSQLMLRMNETAITDCDVPFEKACVGTRSSV